MQLLSLLVSLLLFLASVVASYRLQYSPLHGLRVLAEETDVDRSSLPIWEGGFNVKPWLRDHPELLGGR